MLNEMKYAVALYREGSFSKAAKSLYISQPALSSAIRKLEKECGVILFDRSAVPVHPTEAGMFYIRSALQILAIENNMAEYFDSIQNMKDGSLSIGTSTFYCCYSLPIHLHPYSQMHPNVHIDLVEDTSNANLAARLQRGELDLVLTSNPAHFEEFSKQFFTKESLILAVPSSYPVNEQLKEFALSFQDILEKKHLLRSVPGVSLKDFEALPYISLRQESELYHRAMEMFSRCCISPNFHMYTDQMPTSYFMSYYGYGYSIIRDVTLNIVPQPAEHEKNKVIFYKIDDPHAVRDIFFYYRDLLYQSSAVKAFIRYTRDAQDQKNK